MARGGEGGHRGCWGGASTGVARGGGGTGRDGAERRRLGHGAARRDDGDCTGRGRGSPGLLGRRGDGGGADRRHGGGMVRGGGGSGAGREGGDRCGARAGVDMDFS
nr:rRNA 2'-O-methyltransferase fibrillarin-like [Aegilops tauschii subsp. strangulata]